jgi:hypothetical protein
MVDELSLCDKWHDDSMTRREAMSMMAVTLTAGQGQTKGTPMKITL